MPTCALCNQTAQLRVSHIVPSFVGKWLKQTSVTGFIRQLDNPNLRKQDIHKEPLLCEQCEGAFSVYEKQFAEHVFYPYVQKELDERGVGQGLIRCIPYDEWLLRFVVSLQWRALTTSSKLDEVQVANARIGNRFASAMDSALRDWADYLLGRRETSGEERHYIVFLQNLAAGSGYLPEGLSDNVNMYLLRSIDTTPVFNRNSLLLYTKLGPIAVITSLRPHRLKGMHDALIRKRDSISTAQKLANLRINDFIFVVRPHEAMERYELSETQNKKIASDLKRKAGDAKHLHSLYALESDFLLRESRKLR